MIFNNYIGYVPRYVYLIREQHIVPPTYTPDYVGNQCLIMVQLITNRDRGIICEQVIALIPTTVHVNINLPTQVLRGFAHQTSNGGQLGDSPRESSPEWDAPRGPPFNPPIGSFGWLAPDPHMFTPPWY